MFSVRFLSLQSQRKRHGAKQTEECGSTGRVLKITKFLIPAKVAHLVEHDLAKVGVAGSSPVFRSIFYKVLNTSAKVAHLVEHDLAKVGVAGSSPVFRSKA